WSDGLCIFIFFFGVLLLLLPLLYLMFYVGAPDQAVAPSRLAITDIGKQSAFSLTSMGGPGGRAGSSRVVPKVAPTVEQVDNELDSVWQKIQSVPRIRTFPSDTPIETRQMVEAEDDPDLCEGNSLLDRCEFADAEKHYIEAIGNAGSNYFKELYAWGGLMEVYQLQGDVARFREAFGNFAKAAQKLKHVYGPLADNVARAYQMFEQVKNIDSGKLREYLTRVNLERGSNVSYDEFIKSMNNTKQWFPANLPEPPGTMPEMMQPGSGG
ncbi:MAG TPA: hypothetical protein PLM07_21965, partial [Candidatus Rifleibacterium sp.]|nr:hypothetical protein [Candidatus Rifleibacterium sp.]